MFEGSPGDGEARGPHHLPDIPIVIEVYTEAMELRLLEKKLKSLMAAVKEWYGRKSCTKHELLSFIGMLSHACIVVRPGRRFLRRLINLSEPMHPSQRRVSIGHKGGGSHSSRHGMACQCYGVAKRNTRVPPSVVRRIIYFSVG